MKIKTLALICSILVLSCEKEQQQQALWKPESPEPKGPAPKEVKLRATLNDKEFTDYNGIRIGEHLWMDKNLHSPKDIFDVTQPIINKQLGIYGLTATDYPIGANDFNYHYGQHYSHGYIDMIFRQGKLFIYEDGHYESRWKIASKEDFRQLFGMCDDGMAAGLQKYLMPKPGSHPVIPSKSPNNDSYKRWYSTSNENIYKFNMLMGGARFHGKYTQDEHNYGDVLALFSLCRWATADGGFVELQNNKPFTTGGELRWLKNVRYCRRLTDSELGYKLYINTNETDISKYNANNTDIIKQKLDEEIPPNYYELPKGYLRGFYVQFILDKPTPLKSIQEIVNLAKQTGSL